MGIDDYKVYKITFGIGTVMLGFAAAFLSPFYFIHPAVGDLFVGKSFVIVVLGGLGSISGAFLAGIIVGVIESLGPSLSIPRWWNRSSSLFSSPAL